MSFGDGSETVHSLLTRLMPDTQFFRDKASLTFQYSIEIDSSSFNIIKRLPGGHFKTGIILIDELLISNPGIFKPTILYSVQYPGCLPADF